jgi:soluble lytic murein transglycosylase-like protein
VLHFAVTPPPGSYAHAGLGQVGKPRTGEHSPTSSPAAQGQPHRGRLAARDRARRKRLPRRRGVEQGRAGRDAADARHRAPVPGEESAVAADSIRGGAQLLAELLRRYKGDHALAAAAYNAGVGAVAKYGGVPPYAETQAYVAKVDALYHLYQAALRPATTPPPASASRVNGGAPERAHRPFASPDARRTLAA